MENPIIESAENEKKGYLSKLGTKNSSENKLWDNPFVHSQTEEWYNPNNWAKKECTEQHQPPPPPEPPVVRPEPPQVVVEKLSDEPPPEPNTVPRRNGVVIYLCIFVLTVLLWYILK